MVKEGQNGSHDETTTPHDGLLYERARRRGSFQYTSQSATTCDGGQGTGLGRRADGNRLVAFLPRGKAADRVRTGCPTVELVSPPRIGAHDHERFPFRRLSSGGCEAPSLRTDLVGAGPSGLHAGF